MLNQLTGMVMSVPAELVELYEKAGCKPVIKPKEAEDSKGTENPEGTENPAKGKAKN